MCDEKNGKNKKGDEDMATEVLEQNYTLNESEALKILNSPVKKVNPTNAKHDYKLSKIARIKQARSILDSFK